MDGAGAGAGAVFASLDGDFDSFWLSSLSLDRIRFPFLCVDFSGLCCGFSSAVHSKSSSSSSMERDNDTEEKGEVPSVAV